MGSISLASIYLKTGKLAVAMSRGADITRKKLGKGTTFTIYLPLIRSEAKTAAQHATEPPTGDERILFVDDEKTMVDLGRQMLARLGYHVVCRTSSIEALEFFKSRPDQFDLVISDMTMPNLTGDKLTRQIMGIRPDIPEILCTGIGEQIGGENAKELGLREFILKPLVMEKFARTVRQVLDGG